MENLKRVRLNKIDKMPKKLWIKLTKHCLYKMKRKWDFDEIVRIINHYSWDVNTVPTDEGYHSLRLEELGGCLILSDDMMRGITFVPDDKRDKMDYEGEFKYTERYELSMNLSPFFKNDSNIRLFKKEDGLVVKRDGTTIGFAKLIYKREGFSHAENWTTGFGKIYPNNAHTKVFIEVNESVDKHECRIRFTNEHDKAMGKAKTQEDVDFRRSRVVDNNPKSMNQQFKR